MTLRDYYFSLERPEPPKTSFIKEIADKCGVEMATVRLWVHSKTKPSNPAHAIILSEMTGIAVENLWNDAIH